MTDGALVTRFLQGDIHAFNTLVWRWEKPLLNFIWRQVGCEETAKDLTQVLLIRLYKQLRRLQDPEKFSSWAYRIAVNLCKDEFKQRSRRKTYSLDQMNSHEAEQKLSVSGRNPVESPEDLLQNAQLGEIIRASLMRIPSEQRVVIVMKQYQGLKFTEIAEVLNEPINTIKSRLYYGLKALRKFLEESELSKEDYLHEMS